LVKSSRSWGQYVMINGVVKWFDSKKGYGFITYNQDEEIFVHFTGIAEEGFKSLEVNEIVEFEIKQGARGEQASNVKKI